MDPKNETNEQRKSFLVESRRKGSDDGWSGDVRLGSFEEARDYLRYNKDNPAWELRVVIPVLP